MEFLKSFDLSRSWNRVTAIGAAFVAIALPPQNSALMLVGLGMVAVGFGEGKNHKQSISFTPPDVHGRSAKVTDFERENTITGIGLDLFGFALICAGLWKLLIS